jgi:L-malate glycosyltransferase
MNILLCCEHFFPSVGGVQKMMRELARRFAMHGHRVVVATSWRLDRNHHLVDGIEIVSFKVTGNAVSGMTGEVGNYQQFLLEGQFDFLLVMAAQQWTFDALLPVLDQIKYKKLHIPCGYSGFFLRKYRAYYQQMDTHLKKFDQLIYNASDYRDINFARTHGVANINIIPAGASEFEFMEPPRDAAQTRIELGIEDDDFLYLSVGAPAHNKGHMEILQAYLALDVPFKSALVLNGNYDDIPGIDIAAVIESPRSALKELAKRMLGQSPANIIGLAESNQDTRKKIIFTNLGREKLISLFFEADLFLFASHVEYSPLVIFECLAAGLPFLSIPVGNVVEIAEWSNGGVICPGKISAEGFSFADPTVFSTHIRNLTLDSAKRQSLAANGRQSWLEKFSWGTIAQQIEQLVKPGRG